MEWNLPDDPYERQQRVTEIADDLIERYDAVYFEAMDRILEKVRANIAHTAISNTLDPLSQQELGSPKTP